MEKRDILAVNKLKELKYRSCQQCYHWHQKSNMISCPECDEYYCPTCFNIIWSNDKQCPQCHYDFQLPNNFYCCRRERFDNGYIDIDDDTCDDDNCYHHNNNSVCYRCKLS
jgi:hypothetical protein